MICNANPRLVDFEENLHAIQYAAIARQIKVQVTPYHAIYYQLSLPYTTLNQCLLLFCAVTRG